MTSKPSLYDGVTQSIISAIEANPGNPGKPAMPWHRGAGAPLYMPANALTGNLYQGINTVVLWVAAEQQGYSQPVWSTYRQWAELGCQVRKGEKSTPVVFFKSYEVEPIAENSVDDGKRRVARASAVFNCSQVDGYPESAAVPDLGPVARNQMFDALVAATGAIVVHGGDRRSERIEAHWSEILNLIAKTRDITLAEIAIHLLKAHGERFALSTIWRCLDRHGQTFKKNSARERAGAPGRRRSARRRAESRDHVPSIQHQPGRCEAG